MLDEVDAALDNVNVQKVRGGRKGSVGNHIDDISVYTIYVVNSFLFAIMFVNFTCALRGENRYAITSGSNPSTSSALSFLSRTCSLNMQTCWWAYAKILRGGFNEG